MIKPFGNLLLVKEDKVDEVTNFLKKIKIATNLRPAQRGDLDIILPILKAMFLWLRLLCHAFLPAKDRLATNRFRHGSEPKCINLL